MAKGIFHGSGGGLLIPIKTAFTDNGILARATGLQARDGSTFNRAANPAKFNAIGLQFGYTGTFNTSATPSTNNMTAANLPVGYTASSTYGTNAWKLRDGDSATYFSATGLRNSIAFGFPTQSIGGFKLKSKSPWGNTMVTSGNVQIRLGTEVLDTVNIFHAIYTNDQEVSFSCNFPIGMADNIIINAEGIGQADDTTYYMGDISILPLDLSKIKNVATPFITGDAVTVAPDTGEVLPTGLTLGTIYYVNKIDADNIKFYDTYANAIAGGATGLIAITDAGTGTFKVEHADIFRVDTLEGGIIAY